MGFFDKTNCIICNTESRLNIKVGDIFLCTNCYNLAGGSKALKELNNMSVDDIRKRIDENKKIKEIEQAREQAKKEKEEEEKQLIIKQNNEIHERFKPTRQIRNNLFIDDTNKLFAIQNKISGKIKLDTPIFRFSELKDYEILEDNQTVSKTNIETKKHGLGRAVVGGLMFGGAGAVVGGLTGKTKGKSTTISEEYCNKMQVKITTTDIKNPILYITLISFNTQRNSAIYKTALKEVNQISEMLESIKNDNVNNAQETIKNSDTSPTEEIKKYKELLDMGAITQEEYENKKKELLGL